MITQGELNEFIALTEILKALKIELDNEYGRQYQVIEKEIKEINQRLDWWKQSHIKEDDF